MKKITLVDFSPLLALLTLSGCSNPANSIANSLSNGIDQAIAGKDVGIQKQTTVQLKSLGNRFTEISISQMKKQQIQSAHTDSNDITIQFTIRSEMDSYSLLHQRELHQTTPDNGVYTFRDSSVGCTYELVSSGNLQNRVQALTGSCIETDIIQVPDHDLPRTFIETQPLFNGEILLEDLKAVFADNGFNPGLWTLLNSYVNRLPSGVKPLSIADLGSMLFALTKDDLRLQAIVLVAPRVSDPQNADSLTKMSFNDAANYAKAVKVLKEFSSH